MKSGIFLFVLSLICLVSCDIVYYVIDSNNKTGSVSVKINSNLVQQTHKNANSNPNNIFYINSYQDAGDKIEINDAKHQQRFRSNRPSRPPLLHDLIPRLDQNDNDSDGLHKYQNHDEKIDATSLLQKQATGNFYCNFLDNLLLP